MATAWGSKGWSIGEFGTGNENVLEIPTGQSLTSSLNSVSVIAEVNNGNSIKLLNDLIFSIKMTKEEY